MSDSYLNRLHEEYRRAVEAGQSVMRTAGDEKRDLSPEETETVDRAMGAAADLKAKIDRANAFNEVAAAAGHFIEAAAPVVERSGSKPKTEAEAFRASLKAALTNGFGVYEARFSPEFEARALQSAGGSAIPTTFADFVTVYERTMTPMLNPAVVSVLNRTNGAPLVLPRVTADPAHGGTVTAEAAGINELDATVSSVTLTPFKYAITNLWSSELADDNTIGLEDLIARTTARELSIDIGAHLTTGTGTVQPNGFITAAKNGGTATGTGTTYGTYFGPTDLVNLFYNQAAPYRSVGTWQMNSTSLAQARNGRDTAGNFIWQPALSVGQPETILGRPVYENPAMANGSAAKAVAFGDFSRYFVARVTPIRV